MSPEDRADGDAALARVCLHEYAHCIVARTLGAAGFVRIARVAGGRLRPGGFAGAFQMHGDLCERDWRVVALAGTIAEWLADDPGLAEHEAIERLRRGALPATDAALAAGFDASDVARCVALLREHWATVVAEAGERARASAAAAADAAPDES